MRKIIIGGQEQPTVPLGDLQFLASPTYYNSWKKLAQHAVEFSVKVVVVSYYLAERAVNVAGRMGSDLHEAVGQTRKSFLDTTSKLEKAVEDISAEASKILGLK
jgi:hypothetical protein